MAPIDCNIDPNLSSIRDKTAVVTGGASGIGQAYVRALVDANLYVCFGDKDAVAGKKLESELEGNAKFHQCDVTRWEDQVQLFREAALFSPSGKIHHVVANAGISRRDEVFSFEDEPTEPDLSIIDVNLRGALYTTKIALHHAIKQIGKEISQEQEDTCLVLMGSGAAFLDVHRTPQYCSTKWGARGIMHALRGTAHHYGGRVNVISPWYVRTNILTKEQFDTVESKGVKFADAADAGQALLRILGDTTVNGRMLFVAPREWAPRGYMDFDLDDYEGKELLMQIQEKQLVNAPAGKGLFPSR